MAMTMAISLCTTISIMLHQLASNGEGNLECIVCLHPGISTMQPIIYEPDSRTSTDPEFSFESLLTFVFAQKHTCRPARSNRHHHANGDVSLSKLYGQRNRFLHYLIKMAFQYLLLLCSTYLSQQYHRRLMLSEALQQPSNIRLSDWNVLGLDQFQLPIWTSRTSAATTLPALCCIHNWQMERREVLRIDDIRVCNSEQCSDLTGAEVLYGSVMLEQPLCQDFGTTSKSHSVRCSLGAHEVRGEQVRLCSTGLAIH